MRLLRKLRKIEFIRLTVEFNRNFTFLAIYYSSTSAEEGPTKDNRAKTILYRTKYKKVCRIFYLPAEYHYWKQVLYHLFFLCRLFFIGADGKEIICRPLTYTRTVNNKLSVF